MGINPTTSGQIVTGGNPIVGAGTVNPLSSRGVPVDGVDGVAAQGTLVIAEPVTGGINAQGTLVIAEALIEGDDFTIGSTVYTMRAVPAAAYDIFIGADEAASKLNIVAAINESGTQGVEYYHQTSAHPDVSAAAFAGDDCVLTAKAMGVAGDAIDTLETFDGATNVFDAATLGTTTAGVDPDTMTIDTTVYRFAAEPEQAYDIDLGADEAATKVNIVAAINASGTEGVEYFAGTLAHPTVSAIAFATDDCVLTARSTGTAGNSIATTETFTHVSNVFDATDLGTTTTGVTDVDGSYENIIAAGGYVNDYTNENIYENTGTQAKPAYTKMNA
jgi:hypothetical protein